MTKMKYTPELTARIIEEYKGGKEAKLIASDLSVELETCIPERSIIAKLSALGIYQRKGYLNKRGEAPIKKEEYISRISALLDIDLDLLESLEKTTKMALVLLEKRIRELKS